MSQGFDTFFDIVLIAFSIWMKLIFLKNFRQIRLLPIFGKIDERIIFKELFNHFHQNQRFAKCQSGFFPCDSCILQLLPIVHEINSSFDCDPTIGVSGVFLKLLTRYGMREFYLN